MFRSKTVLIVGAGASCEAEFPDGRRLLTQIAELLDIRYEMGNRQKSGDYVIADAIRRLVPDRQYGDEFNRYLQAAWRIRDASLLGLSIDNIIEQHDDEPLVAACGKLAILRAILQAERSSLLFPDMARNNGVDMAKIAPTWYGRLGQLLTENIPRRKAEEVFENLAVVCFNYDRALQQTLPYLLTTSWGMDLAHARNLSKKLKILHPYGRVSPLPWEDPRNNVEFGYSDYAPYADLIPQIRTFSERLEDEDALSEIRTTVGQATQIIFLGFAFHHPNMDLIRPEEVEAEKVLATVYKLPSNEKRQVANQIIEMFPQAEGGDDLVLHDGTCSDLLKENWRTISA